MRRISVAVAVVAALASASKAHEVVRVAVIDTGIDPTDPRFAGRICPGHVPWNLVTGEPLRRDEHGHGTHIAGLIMQYARDAQFCFLFYRFYSEAAPGSINLRNEVEAIHRAVREGASVVNLSAGGPEFSEDEYLAIKAAPQVRFFVAAGNENQDVGLVRNFYYPGSYRLPNVTAVGALTHDCAARHSTSNYGAPVKVWEQGQNLRSTLPGGKAGYSSGTSQATAVHTGKYLAGQATARCIPQMHLFPWR